MYAFEDATGTYVMYSHIQSVLKLSFGVIRGGKRHSKYFYDLCLSIFL